MRIRARLEAFGGLLKSSPMVLDRSICSGMRIAVPHYKPFGLHKPGADTDITADESKPLIFQWLGRKDGDVYIMELEIESCS